MGEHCSVLGCRHPADCDHIERTPTVSPEEHRRVQAEAAAMRALLQRWEDWARGAGPGTPRDMREARDRALSSDAGRALLGEMEDLRKERDELAATVEGTKRGMEAQARVHAEHLAYLRTRPEVAEKEHLRVVAEAAAYVEHVHRTHAGDGSPMTCSHPACRQAPLLVPRALALLEEMEGLRRKIRSLENDVDALNRTCCERNEDLKRADAESADLRARLERAEAELQDWGQCGVQLLDGAAERLCAGCGRPGTVEWLSEHIRTCPKHPVAAEVRRAVEAEKARCLHWAEAMVAMDHSADWRDAAEAIAQPIRDGMPDPRSRGGA